MPLASSVTSIAATGVRQGHREYKLLAADIYVTLDATPPATEFDLDETESDHDCVNAPSPEVHYATDT
jgi:hypothetical protein